MRTMRTTGLIAILILSACSGNDNEGLPGPPEVSCETADAGVVRVVDDEGNNWAVICD